MVRTLLTVLLLVSGAVQAQGISFLHKNRRGGGIDPLLLTQEFLRATNPPLDVMLPIPWAGMAPRFFCVSVDITTPPAWPADRTQVFITNSSTPFSKLEFWFDNGRPIFTVTDSANRKKAYEGTFAAPLTLARYLMCSDRGTLSLKRDGNTVLGSVAGDGSGFLGPMATTFTMYGSYAGTVQVVCAARVAGICD